MIFHWDILMSNIWTIFNVQLQKNPVLFLPLISNLLMQMLYTEGIRRHYILENHLWFQCLNIIQLTLYGHMIYTKYIFRFVSNYLVLGSTEWICSKFIICIWFWSNTISNHEYKLIFFSSAQGQRLPYPL